MLLRYLLLVKQRYSIDYRYSNGVITFYVTILLVKVASHSHITKQSVLVSFVPAFRASFLALVLPRQ
jgi:hypothetical protein